LSSRPVHGSHVEGFSARHQHGSASGRASHGHVAGLGEDRGALARRREMGLLLKAKTGPTERICAPRGKPSPLGAKRARHGGNAKGAARLRAGPCKGWFSVQSASSRAGWRLGEFPCLRRGKPRGGDELTDGCSNLPKILNRLGRTMGGRLQSPFVRCIRRSRITGGGAKNLRQCIHARIYDGQTGGGHALGRFHKGFGDARHGKRY